MKNKEIQQTKNWYRTQLLKCVAQNPFIIFILFNVQVYAQQETIPRNFGIQIGLNSSILASLAGPSLSLHYAHRTEKVVQLESMLFFDSHSGKAFLSGNTQKNVGFGLAAGVRINVLPKRNWNPSFVFMPGVIYSREKTYSYDDPGRSGLSGSLSLAVSNMFYQKHMVSLGINSGENITAAYIKYGFWFRRTEN